MYPQILRCVHEPKDCWLPCMFCTNLQYYRILGLAGKRLYCSSLPVFITILWVWKLDANLCSVASKYSSACHYLCFWFKMHSWTSQDSFWIRIIHVKFRFSEETISKINGHSSICDGDEWFYMEILWKWSLLDTSMLKEYLNMLQCVV